MDNKNQKNREYEVGYKRPPREYQFKPGQSGNPKGRPKLIKNFSDDLREEAEEILTIIENGKKVKMTKQRAFIKKLTALALNGDKSLIKILATLLSKLPIKIETIDEDLSINDKKILEEFILRQGEKND